MISPASMADSARVRSFGRLAEITPRRGVHAIGAAAEIDLVQIRFEDLILAQAALQRQRVDSFPDLAREAALRADEGELGELLGDGAAALDHVEGHDVFQGGAHDADGIDAEM